MILPLSRLTRSNRLREILDRELYPNQKIEVMCPDCQTRFSTSNYVAPVEAADKAEVIKALIELAEATYPKHEL